MFLKKSRRLTTQQKDGQEIWTVHRISPSTILFIIRKMQNQAILRIPHYQNGKISEVWQYDLTLLMGMRNGTMWQYLAKLLAYLSYEATTPL